MVKAMEEDLKSRFKDHKKKRPHVSGGGLYRQ